MIIRSERKQISPGQFQYRFSEDAREVGTADFIRERSRQTGVHIQVSEKRAELIIPTLFTRKRTGNGVEKEAAKICLEEENTSVFYHTQKGSNIFNGIYFWTVEYQGNHYELYEVGQGRKGIYYCVWLQEQTVAIISKETHTKHFESSYIMYSEDIMPIELLAALSVFWDLTRYYPSDSSEEWHTLNTWQKALKEKYDVGFIQHIKSLEGR